MTLPSLPHDKAMHVVYGYLVACLAALLLWRLPVLSGLAAWQCALLAPAMVGGAKELYDHASGRGTASRWDWFATAAAGAPLALVLWVLH